MSSEPRRYFDHAATSFPKPPGVAAAVRDYIETIGASAGRGAYREAVASGQLLSDCRDAVRRLFGLAPADHVVFGLNGTDALNLAIKGIVRQGDHVVTTAMDHNSVLRPLHALRSRERSGFDLSIVRPEPDTTLIGAELIATAIRPNTTLVVVNHASNVTGALQSLSEIAMVCQLRSVPLLVDAAQSAGHVPLDLSRIPVSLLALPGHKGLLGPLGTGVLCIRAALGEKLRSSREGGTGSLSEQPTQPEHLPDKLEAGSHNAPGLAGLLAALRWLSERGVATLRDHELALSQRLIERLNEIGGLTWFGPRDAQRRVGVFSVRIAGLEPGELSAVLEERYGILTRSGLHCAPLAHETIGTLAGGGTTRISLGPFHTAADIDAVGDALREIARATV